MPKPRRAPTRLPSSSRLKIAKVRGQRGRGRAEGAAPHTPCSPRSIDACAAAASHTLAAAPTTAARRRTSTTPSAAPVVAPPRAHFHATSSHRSDAVGAPRGAVAGLMASQEGHRRGECEGPRLGVVRRSLVPHTRAAPCARSPPHRSRLAPFHCIAHRHRRAPTAAGHVACRDWSQARPASPPPVAFGQAAACGRRRCPFARAQAGGIPRRLLEPRAATPSCRVAPAQMRRGARCGSRHATTAAPSATTRGSGLRYRRAVRLPVVCDYSWFKPWRRV